MNNNTILSWDNTEYKAIYTTQLKDNPIYWNEDINAWIVYSYEYCKAVLLNNDAQIPEPSINDLLSDKAKLLVKKLARLSNNQQHEDARQAALTIFESIKLVSISELLASLLKDQKANKEFDWVAVVAKKLPALVVLKGLGFNDKDCEFITEHIASVVKIMSPAKLPEDIIVIIKVIDEFYAIAENHINSKAFQDCNNAELFVCNLLGLFIQSYDAGRGLLTNAVINLSTYYQRPNIGAILMNKIVNETLRLDPPVHNTRRVAVNDIFLGNKVIKKGDAILIVMAAANLDTSVFNKPLLYNPDRTNNDQHLTFGLGGHNCLAKYFSIDLAVQTCTYLVDHYKVINVIQNEFKYEPQLNVRLIKELTITLQ